MAKAFLFDLEEFVHRTPRVDQEQIKKVNPHRGDILLLDGIFDHSTMDEKLWAVGYKDIRDDEFWVPGHIPGRPLYPGVLMIESAAQLASYMFLSQRPHNSFLGFTGCNAVKFRGQVVPGDRLIIMGQEIKSSARRIVCYIQGIVNGEMVFDAEITGMPI